MENLDQHDLQRPDYLSLGEAFKQASPGAIATAIEKSGIFGWDRFGRWKEFKPDSKEAGRALDAIADVYDYESDPQRSIRDEQHPLDVDAGFPGDLFAQFGWPIGSVPEFVESARSPARTAGSSGAVKLNNTHQKMLLGIAVAKYGYDPSAARSDVPARISGDLALHGIEVSDDTARKHLKAAGESVQLPFRKKPAIAT